MFLKRVQVPDFRVLQDIDISFEPDFFPKIFPLGSLNGGGKSTLLQLIFVLLHCSFDAAKLEYLKNFLYDFKSHSKERTLAKFDIVDNKINRKFEFFVCKDSKIQEIFQNETETSSDLLFSVSIKTEEILAKIQLLERNLDSLENIYKRIEKVDGIAENDEKKIFIRQELVKLVNSEIVDRDSTLYSIYRQLRLSRTHGISIMLEEIQQELEKQIDLYNLELEILYKRKSNSQNILEKVKRYLQSENLLFICNYYTTNNEGSEEEVLLCRCDSQNIEQEKDFLHSLSQKVFLAAPSTQIFLFLSQASRKLLFQDKNQEELDQDSESYNSKIELAKSKLSGFFTYDFFAVNLMIEAFKESRDKDFHNKIKTGEYGNSYQLLLNDLNSMLTNKKINLSPDLSGVVFQLDKEDEKIELYPEDLSHGELKRLSTYMWLRYNDINDAIVLIDEIEIALHPDWQYQIVRDLEEWSNSNQYILATHSYELCTAVTPDHVKELEPKLLKPKPIQ